MAVSEQHLKEMGRRVAEALDEQVPPFDADAAAARWSALVHAPPRVRTQRRGPALAAAAALAAGMLWLVFALRPEAPLSFTVPSQPIASGDWLEAPASHPLPIEFSDGSRLELSPGSRARVVAVGPAGAEVVLEQGILHCEVVHRDKTRWSVRSGPFRIEVTGTRFDTRWDAQRQELEVSLFEGGVRVHGPMLGDGQRVQVGERLTVSAAQRTMKQQSLTSPIATGSAIEPGTPDEPAARVEAVEPAEREAPSTKPRRTMPTPAPAAIPPAPRAAPRPTAPSTTWTWQDLLEQGDHEEAVRMVEQEGFERIRQTVSAADLARLGRAYRLLGQHPRARQVFTGLRTRFAGTPHAAVAAFMLGRAAQQAQEQGTAAVWFETYLREAKNGGFAMEAMGRLIEARVGLGEMPAAQAVAQQYLARYPNGPHEHYARQTLSRLR